MKKKLLLFLFIGSLISFTARSQSTGFGTLNWSEYTFGIGPSLALTDIGGAAGVGSHFLGDVNFPSLRVGGYIGYRRRLARFLSAKAVFTMAELYANDNLSSNVFRKNRNQDFRSIVLEPSLQIEYHFYDAAGHHFKTGHGSTSFGLDVYIFGGLGGFYFNPQGKYNGGLPLPPGMDPNKWYDLRPLSTEGEGLPGGPPVYSQYALSVPVGMGLKYLLNIRWSIGLELSDRYWTSTDYLDDAHGNYFSSQEILQYKGPIAAYFSHPVLGITPDQDLVGTERGNPRYNDTFMFILFTLNYQIRPYQHSKDRAKF